MDKTIFFFASSRDIGLTSHYARQVVDMYKYAQSKGDLFFCVSSVNEQNEGLWSLVRETIPATNIISFSGNNLKEAAEKIDLKIGAQSSTSVVHVQGLAQVFALRNLVRKEKIKLVLTVHSFVVKPFLKKILKGVIAYIMNARYVEKMIFLSPFAMRRYPLFSALERQGKIIHIPFNLPTRAQISNECYFPLEKGKWNIVYLANFLRNKGHEHYKNAIFSFAKKHPDSRFWFFGEGPRRETFYKEVCEAGLEKQIFCPGRVAHKLTHSILSQADVVLSLSAQETAGHNAVEAMLKGVPVIGTRVGSAEYLLQDYITGIVVNSNTSLFTALNLLYSSPFLSQEMGRKAKSVVESLYGYQDMIRAYFYLYHSL